MAHGVPSDRNTGSSGTGSSGSGGGKSSDPPNLLEYQNEPKYDLATIVGLVGVRPMILWGWEQQLGIPTPARVTDDMGGTVRRYSERDLVASIWLRDQILKGVTPSDAVSRLQAAQRPVMRDTESWDGGEVAATFEEPPPIRARVTTGPLPDSMLPSSPPRAYPTSADISKPSASGAHPQSAPAYGPGLGRAATTGSLLRYSYGPAVSTSPQTGRLTGNLYNPYATSDWVDPVSGPLRPTSGPLYNMSAAPASQSFASADPLRREPSLSDAASVGVPWSGPASTGTRGRELRTLLPQLIRAFVSFDTFAANHLVSEGLSSRSVETVCMHLFQPALARIGDLWMRHEISSPEERFAVNYVRGMLFSIFHKTPERYDAPMVIIGCGQRELQDTGALMLAVFCRRLGVRVVYLGQDVEYEGLLDEIRKRRPALVAVDISASQRIRSLVRLARDMERLDAPRPLFGYTGAVFVRHPDLLRKLKGIPYLGDDTALAAFHIATMLGIQGTPSKG
jgi:methanogenic corrinoid protein MtbC1